jgi:hypothetical protein
MRAVNVTALLFARQRLWESPARRGEPRRSSPSTKPRRRWVSGGPLSDQSAAGGDEESFYEVEVTLADGRQTDVQLDPNFLMVGSKTDPAGADNDPDGDGN